MEKTKFLADRLLEYERCPDADVLAIPEINSLPARVRYSGTQGAPYVMVPMEQEKEIPRERERKRKRQWGRDQRRAEQKEKERGRRERATRLPLSTGQQRHKSGIPGMQYIARGWRRGGYKLQSQAWHGMHSHLLHYVIKLNGPGPNTTLGYSHFYSPSPLIPLPLPPLSLSPRLLPLSPLPPPPVHPPRYTVGGHSCISLTMSIDFTSMTKEIVDGYRGKFSILIVGFGRVRFVFFANLQDNT